MTQPPIVWDDVFHPVYKEAFLLMGYRVETGEVDTNSDGLLTASIYRYGNLVSRVLVDPSSIAPHRAHRTLENAAWESLGEEDDIVSAMVKTLRSSVGAIKVHYGRLPTSMAIAPFPVGVTLYLNEDVLLQRPELEPTRTQSMERKAAWAIAELFIWAIKQDLIKPEAIEIPQRTNHL